MKTKKYIRSTLFGICLFFIGLAIGLCDFFKFELADYPIDEEDDY